MIDMGASSCVRQVLKAGPRGVIAAVRCFIPFRREYYRSTGGQVRDQSNPANRDGRHRPPPGEEPAIDGIPVARRTRPLWEPFELQLRSIAVDLCAGTRLVLRAYGLLRRDRELHRRPERTLPT